MALGTLREIWWALVGVLLMAFAVMDGFDFGSAMLLPFVARSDNERRIVINSIGPFWEGNQVWFVLGGGAVFAAWPLVYATGFSTLYLALFLVLLALILRPVAIVYRSKLSDRRWREGCDWVLFASGCLTSLLFGVAFGNLFLGVPFAFDAEMHSHPDISLLKLVSPFALLAGLVSVAMNILHGATWLRLKTTGAIPARADAVVPWAAISFGVLFTLAGLWLLKVDGYRITSALAPDGPSNPLLKTVARLPGAWFANFDAHPFWWAVPLLAYAGAAVAALSRQTLFAFLGSSLVCLATVATAGLALFPFLLPSSTAPDMSLTVWDASSTRMTLLTMLVVTGVFLPLILLYTAWIHRVLRGAVEQIDEHGSY